MIRHCVFVRFGDGSSAAERAAIHADLEALRPAIDGMGKVHFSANVSPEPFARGFGHGFTIDFRDAAARDPYLAHEAHQRAGARLVAALEGGTDGVMVLDLEFTEM
ncbi:Dabb family protein [Mesorhizobium sp. M1A.F.Ca.IN.020.06.1.1]|uniref:Dabb family protein n=1 Tax=unclassified Mesorhizobium TaxID=325217 RepID=UPI000FCA6A8E|nr:MULTISPECIES: Dabb family protein [unclassified Mesorhizobium]RUV06371.1 Dabb family protein [Mesorhizobium sp. M1A.F.Ca.IN.020.03.2.1]RUV90212.1 Dabb family protein [Mesorhizobium sp. M1A.F.Ca.IN.020.32.1.1]RUW13597.1 Dabb family protein [Mesorhizobium sp. M1A.F.Ca.IN.022.05.2.1]RUW36419.1 Dabb family protein [Mesorhizobium sp. M1A.F.Ca.IN.020.06.1.1]RWF84508.1 MAG: Dabb family protein [Mesorhizobium sp.]